VGSTQEITRNPKFQYKITEKETKEKHVQRFDRYQQVFTNMQTSKQAGKQASKQTN